MFIKYVTQVFAFITKHILLNTSHIQFLATKIINKVFPNCVFPCNVGLLGM